MYASRPCAALAAEVRDARHCAVRPEVAWWVVHQSPMAASWAGVCWMVASKPVASRSVRLESVMKQARDMMVSVEGLRPVISQSIQTRGSLERDSGMVGGLLLLLLLFGVGGLMVVGERFKTSLISSGRKMKLELVEVNDDALLSIQEIHELVATAM
jgi:hypothetical protein